MNVLLTGGAGYIGSHTAVELLNRGCDIVIADDYSNSSPVAVERLRQITGRDFPAYHVDVTDREAVHRIFRENKIDCVIHFAGKKAVGESVEIPLSYYRTNLDAALTVLECMKEAGVSRFIFSSSATVYGSLNPIPYREDMPRGECSSPYGTTKAMIEKAVNGVNKQLLSDFRVSENDLFDYLGIDHCVNGDLLGWDTDSGLNVDIFYASRLDEDGMPCLTLEYHTPPKWLGGY